MPKNQTKPELESIVTMFVASQALVQRGPTTFIPVNYLSMQPQPGGNDVVWVPLPRADMQELATQKYNVLFANDSETRNFEYQLRQLAERDTSRNFKILVKTDAGVMQLLDDGELYPHNGAFTPNFIQPVLNENQDDQDEVFKVISQWLDSDEQAHSLLHHLATSLSPFYSAVKYVILIGEGRNGKGVLLQMIVSLFGVENVSAVTRQEMSEKSPVITALNEKLLNVVRDGEMAYIKDSATEKTLIAGEPINVRILYESTPTVVQTNALFIEALNLEPKARDKSSALQKRLARFEFPNVYPIDKAFEKHMTSQRMLGAFLGLLIKHYVKEDEIADKLKLTTKSLELQLDAQWYNSPVLQFLQHLHVGDPNIGRKLKGMTVENFYASFRPWAETQGISDRTDGDLRVMMNQSFVIGMTPAGHGIRGIKPDTQLLLDNMKEINNGSTSDPKAAVVDD